MNAIWTVAPVSVVIPCFRCAETINRAIDSVAQQTQKPAEVILVDDASGDCTLSALQTIESQYGGWVKVIALNQNQGAANARNVGWDLATQPYIALLDTDDAWHPNKIEIQYKFMQENPQVVLCGHNAKIMGDDTQLDWLLSDVESTILSKNSLLIFNSFVTSSVMIKKDIEQRFNSKKRYMEDHLLWLQMAFDDCKVAKLSPALAAVYKQAYGVSGLSSHLWAMEKSELDNYRLLFQNNNIGFISALLLSVYSLTKYMRRLLIVSLR